MKATACVSACALALAMAAARPEAQGPVPEGFVSLFNGKDLSGWRIPEGDGGHWKVVDGVIDYDAGSQSPKDKSLSTEKSFKNFQLKIDWRQGRGDAADERRQRHRAVEHLRVDGEEQRRHPLP